MRAAARIGAGRVGRWSTVHVRAWWGLLRVAAGIGKSIEWMSARGRPAVISLAFALLALLRYDWWKVLVVYSVVALVWAALKARTRVVVDTFEDHSFPAEAAEAKGDPHRPDASGMAPLLAARLAEMRKTYELLEEPLGSPHPERPVDGAVQLEDIGDVLRSSITTQSTLSVGPVTLPIGALMSLVGRMVQAPRLRGAIYGDATELTLTAELIQRRRDYVWRVVRRVGEDETPAQVRTAIVQDLAYRVFTDLSLRRQAEWPATRDWLFALKERQECQRNPGDRRLHLEEAQEHLRKALASDERFYLAAYNLGTVYRQLAEEDARRASVVRSSRRRVADEPYTRSAIRLFTHAMNVDCGRWEAYHGLALAHWKLAQRSDREPEAHRERVIDLCDRALELEPGRAARAQILDLKATAQLELSRCGEALATWQRACAAILWELTLAQLLRVRAVDDQRLPRLRKQASQCLLNLASAYDRNEPDPVGDWRFKRIRALAVSARRLADVDAAAHYRFAEIAERWRRLDLADGDLRRAIRIEPDNAVYRAQLASVLARCRDGAARAACIEAEHAIDFATATEETQRRAIGKLVEAYRLLNMPQEAKAAERRQEVCAEIAKRDLDGLLTKCEQKGWSWEGALVEWQLGLKRLDAGTDQEADAQRLFKEAEDLFRDARQRLDACGRRIDMRRWGLLGLEARAIARQFDRTATALPLAEEGVAIDPLSSDAWAALATVRQHGGDFERADAAWRRALQLNPENPELDVERAGCLCERAQTTTDAGKRRALHRDALEHLHRALRLYDVTQMDQRRRAEWRAANSHWMLGEFGDMPAHLRFLLASLEVAEPDATQSALAALLELVLARAYRETHQFAQAEEYARRSIDDANRAARDGFRLNDSPGEALGDTRWTLGEVGARAHVQLAASHIDRDGSLAFAQHECAEAEKLLHAMIAARVATGVTDLEGDVLAQRGRIALAKHDPALAVRLLHRSATKDPGEAEVYVSLACAYESLAAGQSGEQRKATLEKAHDACDRAMEIVDEQHPHHQAAAAVAKRLDRLRLDTPPTELRGPLHAAGQAVEASPASRAG